MVPGCRQPDAEAGPAVTTAVGPAIMTAAKIIANTRASRDRNMWDSPLGWFQSILRGRPPWRIGQMPGVHTSTPFDAHRTCRRS